MVLETKGGRSHWTYGIVHKHFAHHDEDILYFMPISETHTNATLTEMARRAFTNSYPYRDSTNIQADMKIFQMRAFFVVPEYKHIHEIHYELPEYQNGIVEKLIKK